MTTTTELSFIHRFEPATEPGRPPLLLLHGTGGDENDLLPLGRHDRARLGAAVAARQGAGGRHAALLPPAGARASSTRRTCAAAPTSSPTSSPRRARPTVSRRPIAVGFSNGANIAAAVLQLRPRRSPAPSCCGRWCRLQDPPAADLTGKPVLILSGASDPIVPAENATRLAALLTGAGATVEHRVLPTGHGLSQADVALTKAWIDQL